MANEIQLNTQFSLATGLLTERISEAGSFSLSDTTPSNVGGIPSIGFAAHEALPMGDVAAAGWGFFKNLDATNYVQIGVDNTGTFIPFLRLNAGEFCFVRLATNAPYAKANTAAVQLKYLIFDA